VITIKIDYTKPNKFIDWLSKEKVYVESNSFGIMKTATIGYLTKLHPHLTDCTTLKPLFLDGQYFLGPTLACKLPIPSTKPS